MRQRMAALTDSSLMLLTPLLKVAPHLTPKKFNSSSRVF